MVPFTGSFEGGLQVVSSARKVIFKVPAGPVVAFPDGANISEYGQNNKLPSIVVKNHVDKSAPGGTWQGADCSDGFVIMNNVPEEVALELLDLFERDESPAGLSKVIARAEELGCLDNYTTSLSFVRSKLSPAGKMLDVYTGIVKRDDRDICLVVRDKNGVIWRKLGNDVKHIDSDEILGRDYRLLGGSTMDPKCVPVVAG